MTLADKDLESVLELADDAISSKTGVKLIIAKLDSLHKKDELQEKFGDLENFESFKRLPDMTIKQYIAEFSSRYNKLKKHKTEISKDLLGFKLLKSANLPEYKEELIKATVIQIDYDNIVLKLKSTFSDESNSNNSPDAFELKVKSEPTFLAQNQSSDDEDSDVEQQTEDDLYTYNNKKKFQRKYDKNSPRNKFQSKNSRSTTPSNWRDHSSKESKGKNQVRNGQISRCNICQSINHWVDQCPDKDVESVSYFVHELVLNSVDNTVLHTLLSET